MSSIEEAYAYHEPTKQLLDQICSRHGIDFNLKDANRDKLVRIALEALGYHELAHSIIKIGRPKKGMRSRKMSIWYMRQASAPELRYLSFVIEPSKHSGRFTNYWIVRLIDTLMTRGFTFDQAAYKLGKELEEFDYRYIRNTYNQAISEKD
ncbi:hypothetical protein N8Z80_07635 [Litorivicinus sp.]|nr:hypothetical protein [Litorivicinus sp.]